MKDDKHDGWQPEWWQWQSHRSSPSDTMEKIMSFPFYSKSICGRETWHFLVTEGGSHLCRCCPQTSGKYPTGIYLLQSRGSDPCPPNCFLLGSGRGQYANVTIHFDSLMFQTAALSCLSGSHPGSTKLMASFKQIVPWHQKAPPSRKLYSLPEVLQRQS